MAKVAKKPAASCVARKPKTNKRNVDLNRGKEVTLGDYSHNPSRDSIPVVGFERSVQEYSEIGADSLKSIL